MLAYVLWTGLDKTLCSTLLFVNVCVCVCIEEGNIIIYGVCLSMSVHKGESEVKREGDKEKEGEREGERKGERGKGREREREKEGGREVSETECMREIREREDVLMTIIVDNWCQQQLFLLLIMADWSL